MDNVENDGLTETIMVEGRFIRDLHAHLDKAMTARRATVRRDTGAEPLYDTDAQWRLVEDAMALTGGVVELMDRAMAQARAEYAAHRQARQAADDAACEAFLAAEAEAERQALQDETARGPADPPAG